MYKLYNYKGENSANAIITPQNMGAIGDGVHDDTIAFQNALDDYNYIVGEPNSIYKITSTLHIKSDTVIDLNGSTIICTVKHLFFNFVIGDTFGEYNGNRNIKIKNGIIKNGNISLIHGKDIEISNVQFYNCINDHFIEICACNGLTISNCSFDGMMYLETSVMEYVNIDANAIFSAFPWNNAQNVGSFYDGTPNKNITIKNCIFKLGEGDFANGYNAIGLHGKENQYNDKQTNIIIENNYIFGFSGCGLRINNMENVYIKSNIIIVPSDCIRVGDISESDNIIIAFNFLSGNTLIDLISYDNLQTLYNSTQE